MAETRETNKPDFRNGFPIRDLRDGSRLRPPWKLKYGRKDKRSLERNGRSGRLAPPLFAGSRLYNSHRGGNQG